MPNLTDYSRISPEVQASPSHWIPPQGVLGRILAQARSLVAGVSAARRAELERAVAALASGPAAPDFAAALRAGRSVAVIAEVKRRSPSRGEINAGIGAATQALVYASSGAAAISVLTEREHFGGSLTDLAEVRAAVAIPLLRKDFVVDRTQLWEARLTGASAALLIARALPPTELAALAAEARAVGLEPLIEVRSEEELAAAATAGARVIGVNQRDLETLQVDAAVTARLLPLIPAGLVAIAESGIRSRADVETAAAAGAYAVLVGTVLSAAIDPSVVLRALVGVHRRPRRAH
jgi:indole-3-glycerol phosphate synthase